ncbi:MAG: hypothetical protein HGA31_06030 [Candidatus Moranbacteria bacterium]|nr:hypothetical protein [Candidatus Moranbacteria bacterium]
MTKKMSKLVPVGSVRSEKEEYAYPLSFFIGTNGVDAQYFEYYLRGYVRGIGPIESDSVDSDYLDSPVEISKCELRSELPVEYAFDILPGLALIRWLIGEQIENLECGALLSQGEENLFYFLHPDGEVFLAVAVKWLRGSCEWSVICVDFDDEIERHKAGTRIFISKQPVACEK